MVRYNIKSNIKITGVCINDVGDPGYLEAQDQIQVTNSKQIYRDKRKKDII